MRKLGRQRRKKTGKNWKKRNGNQENGIESRNKRKGENKNDGKKRDEERERNDKEREREGNNEERKSNLHITYIETHR